MSHSNISTSGDGERERKEKKVRINGGKKLPVDKILTVKKNDVSQ